MLSMASSAAPAVGERHPPPVIDAMKSETNVVVLVAGWKWKEGLVSFSMKRLRSNERLPLSPNPSPPLANVCQSITI